ncbi:MAG TPA: hypothetical protein ENK89_06425, partial [Desulfobulbaceae bacterium]|nr:hypothetical protein [Desulfobulbaceae bacterium]
MMARFRIIFILLLLLQVVPPAVAALPADAVPTDSTVLSITVDQLNTRRETLRAEEENVKKLTAEVTEQKKERDRKLAELQDTIVTETTLEQARLTMESARVNVQSASLDLANEKQQVQSLQDELVDLQHQVDAINEKTKKQGRLATLQKQIALAKSLLPIEQDHIELLTTHLGLLQEKADLVESWWQSMQAVFQQQQQIRHQESLDDMKHRLQQQEQKVQEESTRLRQELTTLKNDTPETAGRRELLNRQLESLNESLNILKTKVMIQSMRSTYDGMDLTQLTNLPTDTLKEDMKTLQYMKEQLKPLITLTTGRLNVFQQQWALVQKQYALKNISEDFFSREKKILTNLIEQFNSLLSLLQSFDIQVQQDLDRVEAAYGKSVRRSLSARRTLPHEPAVWKSLFIEFSTLPSRLRQVFTKTANELISGWIQASPGKKLIISGLSLVLLLLAIALGHIPVVKKTQAVRRLQFSAKAKIISLSLLRSSRFLLLSGG